MALSPSKRLFFMADKGKAMREDSSSSSKSGTPDVCYFLHNYLLKFTQLGIKPHQTDKE